MEGPAEDDAEPGCSSNVTYEMDLQQELQSFLDIEEKCDDSDESDEVNAEDANPLFEYDMDDSNFDAEDVSSILTQEEEAVVSNCTDPILRRLLINNRLKCKYLKTLYTRLVKVQHVCEFYYAKEVRAAKEMKKKKKYTYPTKTSVNKLTMPYFKDLNSFFSPHNSDYWKKIKNKEHDLLRYGEGRRWTEKEQRTLQVSVETMYYKHCVLQLENQLANLNMKIGTKRESILDNAQMEKCKTELQTLKENIDERLTPPLNVDTGINWLQAADDLSHKHSETECKAIWNIYLHPHINKKNWTRSEDAKIKQLVAKYKEQDWDAIAEELDTRRSGYLVCVHYYTKLCNKFKKDNFNSKEDELLLKAIEECRVGTFIPWSKVSQYFKNRSKDQLYHRYKYYLLPRNRVKKGHFSIAEDVLLTYMKQNEGKSFVTIAESMSRTSVQLRNRYTNYLQKHFSNLGVFSFEDDLTILAHVKQYGEKNWNDLGVKLNKNRSHVRQRYLTITKYLKKHPEVKIEDIPKRKNLSYMKFKTEREKTVNMLLNKLSTYTGPVTLQVIENFLARGKHTTTVTRWKIAKKSFSLADQKLIDFYKGTCKLKRKRQDMNESSIKESAQRVIKVFELLAGDLEALKNCDTDEDINILSERELNILDVTQKLPALPSTSTFASGMQDFKVKNILPPHLNNILGLRVFIIKYELFKPTFADKNDSALTDINAEQHLFLKHLFALFKWPCIVSVSFPEQLNKTEQQEIVSETITPLVAPKIGRPRKKVYTKIQKMVEAKKRKRANSKDTITYVPRRGRIKTEANTGSDDNANDANIDGANYPSTSSVEKEVGECSTSAMADAMMFVKSDANYEFEDDLRDMNFEETVAECDDQYEEDLEELMSKGKIVTDSKLN